MNEPQAVPSSLKHSKRFATIALITAVVTWLLLMVVAKFVPTPQSAPLPMAPVSK